MKTNFEFVKNLFNKGEKIANNSNNYEANFYRVEICNNNLQLESGCITENGENVFNDDVRECTPSYKEQKKLLNLAKGKTVFIIYED